MPACHGPARGVVYGRWGSRIRRIAAHPHTVRPVPAGIDAGVTVMYSAKWPGGFVPAKPRPAPLLCRIETEACPSAGVSGKHVCHGVEDAEQLAGDGDDEDAVDPHLDPQGGDVGFQCGEIGL